MTKRPERRFWHKLALGLGKSVAQAQRDVDCGEFAWWIAYYKLEPWGEERADLRAGIIAATIATCHRGKGGRSYKPADFMPDFKKHQPKTSEQLYKQMRAFSQVYNAWQASRPRIEKEPEPWRLLENS